MNTNTQIQPESLLEEGYNQIFAQKVPSNSLGRSPITDAYSVYLKGIDYKIVHTRTFSGRVLTVTHKEVSLSDIEQLEVETKTIREWSNGYYKELLNFLRPIIEKQELNKLTLSAQASVVNKI